MAGSGTSEPDEEVARLLLVEDDALDAELAKRMLTDAGLRLSFVVVDTRTAFVDQLTAVKPDVIISDFSLPGFSGADALQIAQRTYPDVPFIIWSGVLDDEAAVRLIKQGATDYLLKDRLARLPSAVTRALAQARQRSRLARIEAQLARAQRLASFGHLVAAQQAMLEIRERLTAERRDATAE